MTSETPEESRNASDETASSETPEEPRNASGEAASSTGTDGDGDERDEDFSLNIAGHEEEKRKREASDLFGGEGDGDDADESESSGDSGESPDDGDNSIISEELGVNPDPEDDEAEPVELLVQLAEDGEIEPWDIDIVTVTDKFLDRLDGADLRTSGRALFYASVLLRMKSDAMLADDDDEEVQEEDPWDEWGPGMDAPPRDADGEFPDFDPVEQLED